MRFDLLSRRKLRRRSFELYPEVVTIITRKSLFSSRRTSKFIRALRKEPKSVLRSKRENGLDNFVTSIIRRN